MFRNLERETAARFSFLLSTPIIAGAALKKLWDLHKAHTGIPHDERMAFLAGILAAAITGGIVIQFFLDLSPPQHALSVHLVPHRFWHNSIRSGHFLPLNGR